MWTRISVLRVVTGKPEGESPLRETGCLGKDNIKIDFKKEDERTYT